MTDTKIETAEQARDGWFVCAAYKGEGEPGDPVAMLARWAAHPTAPQIDDADDTDVVYLVTPVRAWFACALLREGAAQDTFEGWEITAEADPDQFTDVDHLIALLEGAL